jgi:hypothetical protein
MTSDMTHERDEGPPPAQWPRMAAVFGAAVTVRLVTLVPTWAFDRGIIGPRQRGQRILMGFPLMWLRLVGHAATIVAVVSGGNLLHDARRRWLAYQEQVRVLAPYPTPRPSANPRSEV